MNGIQRVLKKSEILQDRKSFVDCRGISIFSFLETYVGSFHWVFSDSWGFYYRGLNHFSVYRDERMIHPFDKNIEDIYGVKTQPIRDLSLNEAVQHCMGLEVPLFIIAEAYYVPWISYDYLKNKHPHFFIITDYNSQKNEVYIIDYYMKFEEWVPLERVELSYNAAAEYTGEYSFYLTKPEKFYPTQTLLQSQLRSLLHNIQGSEPEDGNGVYSGIVGIKKFKEDLSFCELASMDKMIENWWNYLGEIGGLREGALEFIYYLNTSPDSPYQNQISKDLFALLNETANLWFSFRNVIYKYRGQESSTEKYTAFLQKIIENEEKFIEMILKELVSG
ncbi:hypothetical protein SAMN04488542_104166 [Fontibacillus panacisegetis]|uniref:Butirosin biosynthesis protein H, N-terminal n=1 Tax=Fontibacillus panacisegetis TaxID=670482 RepID=A0A1G7HHB6_9BACL|nr:hypothetical protein [Fontibacillus panacisegetis]SDE99778.1 hypothetical protein SAMN04488542_104166 [Fontibacillus panacisegetis]